MLNRLSISCHPKDKEHLILFRDTIGAYHTNVQDRIKKDKRSSLLYPISELKISHQNMREGLEKWGIIPNKTYNLRNIPLLWSDPIIMPHFIRGLFDSDGTIPIRYNNGGIRDVSVSVDGLDF